ncbi:Dyp-type peroxidase [Fibrisoma montanum]|uniref:Dyp-type peroxidase n=1 Tax=Fibrisoma montanum TaxID=2305895 RepID=A0A418MEU5_9BACT|nr:Dyp-type peroxidase [Fibrisoma montanum]RIV25296.1 Dyp-type peroxidase [Fibrisoma montanum]
MTKLLNQFDPSDENQKLFEGIQGNILKAHGRHHTANVFIRCDDGRQGRAKDWLNSLVEGDGAIVRSAYAQLRNNAVFKESGGKADTGLFACIHISAAGYAYLFDETVKSSFTDESFRNGMKKAELNDPDSGTWDTGLAEENHFMLLLAHADAEELVKAVTDVQQEVGAFANISTIEYGKALFNEEGAGIEHFGYVDGVSQPLFFEDEWETYKANNNIKSDNGPDIKFDPRAKKELVLIQDPLAPDANALGSYFVFRKLQQDVKGFKRAEEKLAHQLRLTGEDEERAGALLVGRFEDGTPIQLRGEEGLIHSALWNNFDYKDDKGNIADFSRCPFHAHIRKSNPRSGLNGGGMDEAKKHIMARRGIPYGTRSEDLYDGSVPAKPEDGVGLLFMSYQASIVKQFEFIQKSWVNNPSFPNFDNDELDGIDPIIGQGQGTRTGRFATDWGESGSSESASFEQFVHMKGGEYFFAPSMSFLKNIHTIKINKQNEKPPHLAANAEFVS